MGAGKCMSLRLRSSEGEMGNGSLRCGEEGRIASLAGVLDIGLQRIAMGFDIQVLVRRETDL